MRIIILLLLLLLIANSCRVIFDGYDPDPLYNRKYYVEPRGYARPIPRYIEPNPLYSPPGYYWYPGYIQRERVIIIKPQDKTNYGKRPSRDIGDYNPNFKPQRGRPN